jgi:hypothetical protein
MPDGYQTLITFASNPSVKFWEKQIKPPGIDGGDKIDTTTMHNVAWRTTSPRHLKTLTDSSCQAAYDPDVITEIETLVNKEDTITVHFPTGDSICFYGFLKSFEPGELKEGEFPEAAITIVPTNWDPLAHVEAGPVYTSVSGT